MLFGANAAGKTNLLEALVVLSLGRSHRTTVEPEMISWGQPFARLEAEVRRIGPRRGVQASAPGDPPAQRDRLEVAFAADGAASGRKRIRINGVSRRASALGDSLRVVLFAPEEMLLVVGAPSLRRSALDTLASQRSPLYGQTLAAYGRALQQRNGLLRTIRDGLAHPAELRPWDTLLVAEGATLVSQRLELLDELAEPISAAHAEIAPSEGMLALRYLSNAPAVAGETPAEALRRRLSETAEKEQWNGATLVGPHRDDLVFELGGRDLSTFGSRGQQRSAILALKLAQLDLLERLDGRPPLLLLDDVFSELDPERRRHLVRRIELLPQAFVTTTALEDLDPELLAASTTWRVSPGRLDGASGIGPS